MLGCLLIDGQSFAAISDLKIKRDNFFDSRHGEIFEAVCALSLASQPIDYVTVSSKLKEFGKLEEVGGASALSDLADAQISSANIYAYAKAVKDRYSMREIIRTAMRVSEMGMSFQGETEDFVNEVEGAFFKLTSDTREGKIVSLSECLKENLRELEDASRNPGDINGLSTGYTKIDELLLGMQAGQLIVLGARPSMGKTSLALNIAVNVCTQHSAPVAIFSLEMEASELSMRLLSSRAKVDSKRLRTKDFVSTDLRSISQAVQELSNLPVFINDSGNSTLLDIQSQCRKIKADQGLALVVVDYLQLMKSVVGHNSKNISREQEVSEFSRGLKALAKELKCPVVVLAQLNRQVEARVDKRPNLADLRDSGAIEQDADLVAFIYRDEFYDQNTKEPGVAELIVAKNRSGETGVVKLAWVGEYTSFENLAYGDAPPQ